MPNKGAVAKCPFYERENQTMIFCETDFEEDGIYSVMVFEDAGKKAKFKMEHCCRYPDMKCHYADYMNRIYEGRSDK